MLTFLRNDNVNVFSQLSAGVVKVGYNSKYTLYVNICIEHIVIHREDPDDIEKRRCVKELKTKDH